jgi:hypothetical protein
MILVKQAQRFFCVYYAPQILNREIARMAQATSASL